jgi:hypothetical protein
VNAQEALRAHAAAEKAYSEHKFEEGVCWHEPRPGGSPILCPKRLLRNIAFGNYTKHTHPSLLKGGSQ